jgi:hypothetical protein
MPTAYDPLTGAEVDTATEEWRHLCECQWLLNAKPTRSQKHMYLYGVPDRAKLFKTDPKTGAVTVTTDFPKGVRPLMKVRSLEAADRILADARKLHELTATA